MTDAERVEEIRQRGTLLGAERWTTRDGDLNGRIWNIGPIAGYDHDALELDEDRDASLIEALQYIPADRRFLLAQYDAQKKLCLDTAEALGNRSRGIAALKAENGKLREALHLLVVCIVERNPSHVQASMLGNAIDTACKALGKPLGYWREGGQDDDETVS